MSEYTHIFLREKGQPVLTFREYRSAEDELKGLSEEQIKASYAEVDAYNETVRKSFGCVLFYLCTTPSRQLTVLPYSEDPQLFSKELLEEVLAFYEEKIRSLNDLIAKDRSQLEILEKRILLATPALYDKISLDIEKHRSYIGEEQESLMCWKDNYRKFQFVKDIIDNSDNSGYELIYTKC